MGKRELLLLLAFLFLGLVVYQVTAPAGTPNGSGRSWSDVFRNIRGEVFGSRARVSVERAATAAVGPGVKVLDLGEFSGQLSVEGEDREDIAATVRLSLLGENDQEVNAAAGQLVVAFKEDGERLSLAVSHPDEWRLRRGRVAADVQVKVPRRLLVRADGRGNVEVRQTAGASLRAVNGTFTVAGLSGPLTGEFRDGSLAVDGAAKVDVETRRVSVTLARVEGDVRVEATDGQVRASDVPGTVHLELRRVMVDLDEVGGRLEISGSDGRADLRRVAGPVEIDVRRMGITATLVRAADAEFDVSEGPLEIALPPGGVTLDAETSDGSIEVAGDLPEAEREGATTRLKAEIDGGGPVVRVRGSRTVMKVRRP